MVTISCVQNLQNQNTISCSKTKTFLNQFLHWNGDFNAKNSLGNMETQKQQNKKVLTNSPKSKDLRTHNVVRNDKTITAPENKVRTKTEVKGFIVIS